jgi:tetratricopeptide (TPR) repeat protein
MKPVHHTPRITAAQLMDDAQASMKKFEYYEALHALNAFLLFHPNDQEALLLKGQCYLNMGHTDKARFLFDWVMENNPDLANAYYCQAIYYKTVMNYTTALEYVLGALANNPEHANYCQLAAEISYFAGNLNDSYALINRAIISAPFREELYLWRAIILDKYNKPLIALSDLNRALALKPSYADAMHLRAKINMQLGNQEAYMKDLYQLEQITIMRTQPGSHAA